MVSDRPIRRMTLRELLTHAGKMTHEVSDLTNRSFQSRLADLRDLSRPTRRNSQYPSVISLQNAVLHYAEGSRELLDVMASLEEHVQAIREQASRARFERR